MSGPNARPKGVADGYLVNIPELLGRRYHDGETQEAMRAWRGPQGARFRHVGGSARQIRWVTFPEVSGRAARRDKVADATLPRKSSKESSRYPYRKPTQVGEEKILRRE